MLIFLKIMGGNPGKFNLRYTVGNHKSWGRQFVFNPTRKEKLLIVFAQECGEIRAGLQKE